jgi:hypothetical protein
MPDPKPSRPAPVDTGPVANLTLPAHDHLDAARRWQALLDAGLYPNRNPPAPPAVVAQREANDALFRSFRRRR